MSKVALGKGLGALIQPRVATPQPEPGERVQQILLTDIIPSPLQPRSEFRGERLQELVDSIRDRGIIQPLIVRKRDGKYELIAGERRWRAAQQVGIKEAPVIVREAGDQEVLELALIENIQREDLNPIEEAMAYQRLAKEFGLRQEDIAQKVGKSRAAIANTMRLLELAPDVRSWLTQGRISVGHAKVLLGAKTHEEQSLLANAILRQNLTVRATEKLLSTHLARQASPRQGANGGASPAFQNMSPALLHLQNRLQQHLATHVVLHHGEKRGRLEIEYYGTDDLQRLLLVLGLSDE
ncbi:MAG: ParB/RepB/Spo0J family partition protein [Verrucomicrobiota bacterium]